MSQCVERTNARRHTRFGVSRRERFVRLEKAPLKSLPVNGFGGRECNEVTFHADGYVLAGTVL